MGLTVSEGAGSFELAPAGTHIARCYSIIDLGSQVSEYQGEKKTARKVLLRWELLGDDRMADGRPFIVAKRYTASLHEKAQLRKDLAGWRGRDFTPEELKGFELQKVLGHHCMINVIHVEKAGQHCQHHAAAQGHAEAGRRQSAGFIRSGQVRSGSVRHPERRTTDRNIPDA